MKKFQVILFTFVLFIIFSIIYLYVSQSKLKTSVTEKIIKLIGVEKINETMEISTTESFDTKAQPPDDDYTRLINLNNFQFLHTVECTLADGNYPSLLIAVHTAPENVQKRQVIRETWGMQRPNIKLVFMMGVPQKQEEISIAGTEHEKYKDIVQGNFVDSYRNLTYKHQMVLKYTVYHCPKIKYLLKTDDDVFINTENLENYLFPFIDMRDMKASELLYCLPMIGSPAIREESKWQVTFEEFPDEVYPPYCSGFAEVFSSDTALRIYREAQILKFLWIDDAFITGIAREAAKIIITRIPETLYLKYNEMKTILLINNSYPDMVYPFLLGPVNIQSEQIRALWHVITHIKHT